MHTNEHIVREYLRAFNDGDLDRVEDLLTDDVVVHFPGRSPMAGAKRGKDDVMGFFRTMVSRAGVGSMPPDIQDVCVSEQHAVALITRHIAGIDATVAVVYRIDGGKIAEVWPHERDQYAVDEALNAAAPGA